MGNYTTSVTERSGPADEINPNQILQEWFDVANIIILPDKLDKHFPVLRQTGSLIHGNTYEIGVGPKYSQAGDRYAAAELLHEMWHRWDLRYGSRERPPSKHKAHYCPVELRRKMLACGLRPITDPLVAAFLPKHALEIEPNSEADAFALLIEDKGLSLQAARPKDPRRSKLKQHNIACEPCKVNRRSQSGPDISWAINGQSRCHCARTFTVSVNMRDQEGNRVIVLKPGEQPVAATEEEFGVCPEQEEYML